MRILLMLSLLLPLATQNLWAQSYSPTTMWPYIYPEFQSGTVYLQNNTKVDGQYNVHLLECDLHKLDGDKVISLDHKPIGRVDIGSDSYLYIDGQLHRLIAENARAQVLYHVIGDFDKLMSGSGAYGSTLNTSGRTELSSIEIGGRNTTNHSIMRQNRDNARSLPTKEKFYIIIDGKVMPATNKHITQHLPEDKRAEWKEFVKKHKIKWSKEKSLAVIVEFFI